MSQPKDPMNTTAKYQKETGRADDSKRYQSEAVLQDVETATDDAEEARRMGGG